MRHYLLRCIVRVRRFSAASIDAVCLGSARIARGCLLTACAVGFVGNASAGGFTGLGVINASIGGILKNANIGVDLPDAARSISPERPLVKRAQASTGQEAGPPVNGLIVRFSSPEAKRLSRENLPPLPALIDEINELARTPLVFVRAMSLECFVFRFTVPLGWSQVQAIADRLKQSANVEWVEPDAQADHLLVPNDTSAPLQWNLMSPTTYPGSANLYPAWNITTGSAATVVAVVDTGIRPSTEFYSRVVAGYDFISDPTTANDGDGDGRDADPLDPGNWNLAGECGVDSKQKDSNWHGNHVTGIIAATGNNALQIAGMNWQTRILPVRVLGKCGGNRSDIIDGMLWAAGITVPGVPANLNPAKVINMSLGGSSPGGCGASAYQDAINQIKARGVLIVVAAGNSNDEAANFVPASCNGVMTVGAVGPAGYRASYSNYSQDYKVDISAPGGDMGATYGSAGGIYSTVNTGKTVPETTTTIAPYQGTSMAAPHVAGIASLAWARDSLIAPEMLALAILYASRSFPSDSQCTKSYPLCGVGIVDAERTLLMVDLLKPYSIIYEYYNINLNHYFRTSGAPESQSVLTGGAGAGWIDTKDYFLAWRDGTQGAVPVCRFYGTPGKGPNSHFYTADAGECAFVKKDPGWTYEGVAFYAKLPVNGTCPTTTIAINRIYNNRSMYNDSNHRFTTDASVVQDLVGKGWVAEGTVMCAASG